MKELRRWEEDNRAFRISLRMTENHKLLASVYENLVDRNFLTAEKDIKKVIADLKLIIKSIEDDDF
jgi:hypothetical protein